MKAFTKSLQENIQLIQEDVNDKITDVTISLFRKVVNKSPSWFIFNSEYSEGWLINQWYPSVKSASKAIDSAKSDYGRDSLERIDQLKDTNFFLKKDNSIYLSNNVPYGQYAEVLGWQPSDNPRWRGHAPYAMMELSLIEKKAELG